MQYVYVLQSESDNSFYVGVTHDLRKRFTTHQEGRVQATKTKIPYRLVYYEAYSAEEDAWQRERMLKYHSGAMTHLKKRIKNSILS